MKNTSTTVIILSIIVLSAVLLTGMILTTGVQDLIEGYFYGVVLATSLPVGALGIRLIYALTGGRWGVPLRDYIVFFSRLIPAALLLWLPVFFLLPHIYSWAQPQAVPVDPLLLKKAGYLNIPFFIVRSVGCFFLWIITAAWLDRHTDEGKLAGMWTVFYVLSGTFAAMDWVMTLLPRWYSTIFGITFLSGQVLMAFCVIVLVQGISSAKITVAPEERNGTFIDQGNLLLTMLMFWAYLAFSQLLIIWMGNKPQEILWYRAHIAAGWGGMPAVIIVGHFFVPFFLLLQREWKTSPLFLAGVAALVLAMRACDIGWMVFSGLSKSFAALTVTHFGAVLLVIVLFVLAGRWQAWRSEASS